jgi:hypothetical protein
MAGVRSPVDLAHARSEPTADNVRFARQLKPPLRRLRVGQNDELVACLRGARNGARVEGLGLVGELADNGLVLRCPLSLPSSGYRCADSVLRTRKPLRALRLHMGTFPGGAGAGCPARPAR